MSRRLCQPARQSASEVPPSFDRYGLSGPAPIASRGVKLDLADRYRMALRLLRSFETDAPGLMARVPAECPYSLDQILGGAGDEDWFPAARSGAS